MQRVNRYSLGLLLAVLSAPLWGVAHAAESGAKAQTGGEALVDEMKSRAELGDAQAQSRCGQFLAPHIDIEFYAGNFDYVGV